MDKASRMNRLSYFFTMLFALPAISLGNLVARTDSFIAGFGVLGTLVLLPFLIIWTARRLRNSGHSAWWALGLIPPFTIFLLLFAIFAPEKSDSTEKSLYIYGVRAKGWRILPIVLITLFLAYMMILFMAGLSDGL